MVSLRKYLYGPWQASSSVEDPTRQTLVDLILHIVDCMEKHVLGAAADDDLRERLSSLRSPFTTDDDETAHVDMKREFASIFKAYRERVNKLARTQNYDLYQILTTLNEALMLLAAGSSRTVSRLKQLEVSLERATSMNEITALKSRLSEILALVREEARVERSQSHKERQTFEKRLQQIRQGNRSLDANLPGRDEGISTLERLANPSRRTEPGQYCAAIFVLKRMPEIIRRYGNSAASDLIAELILRRLSFPQGEPTAFRWTPQSAMICIRWLEGVESLKTHIEPQVQTPLEHRLFLGARVAVLHVDLNWVVLPVSGETRGLVEQIDAFISEKS